MKKEYKRAELEIVLVNADVITNSGGDLPEQPGFIDEEIEDI